MTSHKPQATSHKPQATSHKPQKPSQQGANSKPFSLTATAAGVLGMGALLAAGTAQAADSARVMWNTNGHFYQLFEGAPIAWSNAKTSCENKSAHLATLTSAAEEGFVYNLMAGHPQWSNYWVGGTSADTYTWTWITSEAWGYTHWYIPGGYPKNITGQGSLFVQKADGASNYNLFWLNGSASDQTTAYICEWSTQNYIDTALVPDQNGNGVPEVAALFVDYKTGKHTVQIKDPKTKKLLYTLFFATSFTPPSGLVVLKDTNGNGKPEIGVLFTQYGFPNVQVNDLAKPNAALRNIAFMNPNFKPKSVAAGADANHNGADEIVVLGTNKSTGAAAVEIRDSKTGAVSNSASF